uniref:Uncharacterized protein n=1 Tax=Romanomermis culicivorax TaxID=13658 RepID=A0A915HWY6_ROMCU
MEVIPIHSLICDSIGTTFSRIISKNVQCYGNDQKQECECRNFNVFTLGAAYKQKRDLLNNRSACPRSYSDLLSDYK